MFNCKDPRSSAHSNPRIRRDANRATRVCMRRVHSFSLRNIFISFVSVIAIISVISVIIFGAYKIYENSLPSGFNASSRESILSNSRNKSHNATKKYRFRFNVSNEEVDKILKSMTLEDKIAQMFMVTPEQLIGVKNAVTSTNRATYKRFYAIPVGGIMYKSENLLDPNQTKNMISSFQSLSQSRVSLPALISVDEEGGTVARVSKNHAMNVKDSPNMSDIGASKKTIKALQIGRYMGKYLSDLGFNVDFAPVADVLTNPNNELMRKRSFGSDPNLVTNMTSAFTQGLQSSNIFATYKHFPGHGSTKEDSHKGITISDLNEKELEHVDLKPFKDASEIGVQFIMVSHVSYPKVTGDNTPASMSEKIVTGLARKKLKYDGVLISDSMGMGAITNSFSSGQAAVQSIRAGLDMLLCPQDLSVAYKSVLRAVRNGSISEKRIDESVRRIIRVKLHLESSSLN